MNSKPDSAQEAHAASPERPPTAAARPSFLRVIYGLYAWVVFVVGAVVALLVTIAVPGLRRRRRWVTRCARVPFHLAGIRTTVTGMDKLPPGHCVVVANHASYVDGIVLQAFLPPRFSYVIKGEMQNVPVAGFLLRRLGAHFVDRFSAGGSARDARSLLRAADNGDSLAFFPEGTFTPQPGLAAFRGGAFAAATRASVPLVPVVIRGTRQILPAESMLPGRAHLRIDILEPLDPTSADSTKHLAELARQRILTVLDEPDLLAAAHA